MDALCTARVAWYPGRSLGAVSHARERDDAAADGSCAAIASEGARKAGGAAEPLHLLLESVEAAWRPSGGSDGSESHAGGSGEGVEEGSATADVGRRNEEEGVQVETAWQALGSFFFTPNS